MIRTVISLDPDDKRWLDDLAEAERTSMTAIVRRAVRLLREKTPAAKPSVDDLLSATRGTWKNGDGLAYQVSERSGWDGE